jgi:hypothetical protein
MAAMRASHVVERLVGTSEARLTVCATKKDAAKTEIPILLSKRNTVVGTSANGIDLAEAIEYL